MKNKIHIETQDPDVGHTVLLWLADLVKDSLETGKANSILIGDRHEVGRPYRESKDFEDFSLHVDEGKTVHILCSSSLIHLQRSAAIETFRKILLKARLTYDISSLDHIQVIRHQQRIRHLFRALLGIENKRPACRFLFRIDDFPSRFADSESFLEFHAIVREYQIPYLLAVTPFIERDNGPQNLTDRELEILHYCTDHGVELALHGFTHERRYANFPSELLSMPAKELQNQLDRCEKYFRGNDLQTIGFVAPFNSYDPLTLAIIAKRFPIFGGGPETVRSIGYKAGPCYSMGSLYMPSYRYAYDINEKGFGHLDAILNESSGLTVPITLHWANEVKNNFRSLQKLCQKINSYATTWKSYLQYANQVKDLMEPRSE